MTQDQFVECWKAACRHSHAMFSHAFSGGISCVSKWEVTVGHITLRVGSFGSPELDFPDRQVWPRLNGEKCVDGDSLTVDQYKECRSIFEVRQCLDLRGNGPALLEYLTK